MKRHSWVRLREHTYMCRGCGAGKVNIEVGTSMWVQEWSLPDGTKRRLRRAPECAVGVKTKERLDRLVDFLAKHGEAPKESAVA